jgi:hypothetical protein
MSDKPIWKSAEEALLASDEEDTIINGKPAERRLEEDLSTLNMDDDILDFEMVDLPIPSPSPLPPLCNDDKMDVEEATENQETKGYQEMLKNPEPSGVPFRHPISIPTTPTKLVESVINPIPVPWATYFKPCRFSSSAYIKSTSFHNPIFRRLLK